jgi:hypothetical protein
MSIHFFKKMDEENKKCEFYYDLYYFPLSSLIGWISDRTVIQLTAVKGKQSLPLLHLRSLLPSISALFCFVLSLSLSLSLFQNQAQQRRRSAFLFFSGDLSIRGAV